jgi:hypothetical protein
MRLSINISSITKQLLQSEIDKNVLVKKLVEVSEINQIKKDDSSEAFLKFISDSRDVAYQYIEDVQSVLDKFIKDIEPEIEYFKEYGDVSAMAPNYYSMKKIVNSYQELKVLLPKDMVE